MRGLAVTISAGCFGKEEKIGCDWRRMLNGQSDELYDSVISLEPLVRNYSLSSLLFNKVKKNALCIRSVRILLIWLGYVPVKIPVLL